MAIGPIRTPRGKPVGWSSPCQLCGAYVGHHRDCPAYPAMPPSAAVLAIECQLCGAPTGWPCKLTGSHLARWLRAFSLDLIDRAELVGALHGLIVIAATQVIDESADAAQSTQHEPAMASVGCATGEVRDG